MSHPPQQGLYEDNPRAEVAPFLPDGVESALDVGCGRGGFGVTLRQRYGPTARLVGLEPVPEQAEVAKEGHGFDEVIQGWFPDALEGGTETFDLISFNDVVEHVVDPEALLRQCHQRLSRHGRVLATIPNVGYAPVVWSLVRGRWEYADDGVLDRTHLRFFTRRSMVALMESAGFHVDRCEGVNSLARHWPQDPLLPRRIVKRSLAAALGERQYLQFVLVAHPRS